MEDLSCAELIPNQWISLIDEFLKNLSPWIKAMETAQATFSTAPSSELINEEVMREGEKLKREPRSNISEVDEELYGKSYGLMEQIKKAIKEHFQPRKDFKISKRGRPEIIKDLSLK